MPTIVKPKGLAKIWREIKRPLRQIRKRLFGYVDLNRHMDPWGNMELEELQKLRDQLVEGTDALSREVAARFIARRLFCAERDWHPAFRENMWDTISKLLRFTLPLDYEEQKRIQSLGKSYCCPYKFPLLPSSEHMATHFGLNQFPQEIQKKVLNKDVIDGGGYVGDSAMVFTEHNPRKVYVFEPNPDTLPAMRQIIENNATVLGERKDKIEIVPLALGKSAGTVTFRSGGVFDGGAAICPNASKGNTHKVNVISIDEFVKKNALDVGLIKLDVEGAEYDTILGAKETITKQKPILIISIYHTFKDFFEIKPLIESWGVGYKFEIRHHRPLAYDWEFMLMAY